jgi:hypothetical protein
MNARFALWMIGLVAAAPSAAMAAAGFGSSQSGASFAIATISTAAPDIVRTVTVQCPANGKLWANATGRIAYQATSPTFSGTVVYALSRNSTSMQIDFQHNIFGFVDQFVTMPISIQRVDGCSNNQNVTYRLLATKGTFSADYTVAKPALVVSFEPD